MEEISDANGVRGILGEFIPAAVLGVLLEICNGVFRFGHLNV